MPPERATRAPVTDIAAERERRTELVVWEEPPANAHSGRRSISDRLAPHLAELEANPGRWARLESFDGKSSANTGACRLRKAKGEGWEFRAARDADGSKLYGRFVGK